MAEDLGELDVSVVLPCHNEQDHVEAEIDRICAALRASPYTFEVVAIDDASTDDTPEALRRAAKAHPELVITTFRRNGGAGTARRIGTQSARGRYVAWTDADMTYPNERIPELVDMLQTDETYDQVVGARTSEQGTMRVLRVPAKWFVRKLAERLTGERIPDLNSGLRVFRREVALPYLPLLPPGFSCVTTITLSFLSNQHDIKYTPIEYKPRAGRSKFSPVKDAYRYLLQVFRMVMYFNPLSVLMPPALAMLGVAFVKAFYDMWRTPFYVHTNTIVLFLTGLIIGTLALLADLIVRSRPQG
ncbi:MAG TPA: glycosyltransferase family 2 protein [Candidatus Nanopelagicales bacterium]|nr:glycosyltransferase family 2 protein [Candidatus Nanopelagicales bacterium]